LRDALSKLRHHVNNFLDYFLWEDGEEDDLVVLAQLFDCLFQAMWPGFDSSKHVLRIDLAFDLENHGIIEIDSFLAIIWIIQLEKEVNRLNDNSICMLSTVSILYLKVLDLLGSLIWIIHSEISPIVLSILVQQQ
jgi:hypothetical protein